MENIAIGNTNNNSAHLAGAAAPKTETQAAERNMQRIAETKESADLTFNKDDSEDARLQAVKRASQHMAANSFAVSDVRFTIYKDQVGGAESEFVFITRFTSLRDGKVTVVPEQGVHSSAGQNQGTLVDGRI